MVRSPWIPSGIAAAAVCLVLGATGARSETCLVGACHGSLSSQKFLHGPVAAEEAGVDGCASCHEPVGEACTAVKAGRYRLRAAKDRLCLLCHESGTGSQHTRTRGQCLSCHSPHGSDQSAALLRTGG